MVRTSDILKADVLIVDDEPADVLLLERMLRSAGYTCVASTADALRACELHRRNRYGLIVLDLGMAGTSAYQVIDGLEEIEAEIGAGGPLPVLAIAAQAGDRTRALRAGVRESISRPFDRVGVLTRVRDMLKARLRRIDAKNCSSQEDFRLMVESITDCAIVQLDADGRVLSWNCGAQRIKGWRAREIIGQHCSRFYAPEDIARGTPQRDLGLAAQGRFETEGWRSRKDGSTFWANVVFTAVRDSGGALRGFAKLTRDFTGRRQLEAHRKQNQERLESAALREAKHSGKNGYRIFDHDAPVGVAES